MNKIKIIKIIITILVSVLCVISMGIRYYSTRQYEIALKEYNNGQYNEAINDFKTILYFRDSEQKVEELEEIINEQETKEVTYQEAIGFYNDKAYSRAADLFNQIIDYKDSEYYYKETISYVNAAKESAYDSALTEFNNKNYENALIGFSVLEDYKESSTYVEKCYEAIRYQLADTVSADTLYSLAIGENEVFYSGQIEFDVESINREDLVSLSSGVYYTAALYKDGHAVIYGDIPWYNKIEDRQFEEVLQISSAADYVAILHKDRTVEFVGYDDATFYGESLDFSSWKEIRCIDSGYHLTAGVDLKGNVFVTGRNAIKIGEEISANKSKWKDVVKVAVGGGDEKEDGFVIGLKKDGSLVAAGDIDEGIYAVEDWSNITDISAADYHVIGIDVDGKVIATMNKNSSNSNWAGMACCNLDNWPTDIVAVEAGNGISLGISSDGTVYTCGYDHQNQIPRSEEWLNINVYNEWISVGNDN